MPHVGCSDNLDLLCDHAAIQSRQDLTHIDPRLTSVDDIENTSRDRIILINSRVRILDRRFFGQIQWLMEQNSNLCVLKHPAWIVLNTEHVLPRNDKDYWSMNLRPVYFFDDSCWEWQT